MVYDGMSSELEQLKIAYETLRMSPEEIAEDRELDISAVKAGLMQCSAAYRRDCGVESKEEDKLNFSDQDLLDVNEVIKQIAMYGEDDNLRLKAATYIRDDKKGRRDVAKQIGGMTFNLLQFNQMMEQTREIAGRAKQKLVGNNSITV